MRWPLGRFPRRKPHPKLDRINAAWGNSSEAREEAAKREGARVASNLDRHYGSTQPPEARAVDRATAADVQAISPDFSARSESHEKKIAKHGPKLNRLRDRCLGAQAVADGVVAHVAELIQQLP